MPMACQSSVESVRIEHSRIRPYAKFSARRFALIGVRPFCCLALRMKDAADYFSRSHLEEEEKERERSLLGLIVQDWLFAGLRAVCDAHTPKVSVSLVLRHVPRRHTLLGRRGQAGE